MALAALALLAIQLTSGCKKEESKAPVRETAATATDPEMAAVLEQLNKQLLRCVEEKKINPKTFEEFVASGYVNPVPTPPPGKKFVVSWRELQVTLEQESH
jgi:hypothetical protein